MLRIVFCAINVGERETQAVLAVLQQVGMQVHVASSLELLTGYVERDDPDAILVLTLEPTKELLQVVADLRKRFDRLATFVVTPHERILDRVLALRSGVQHYYIQPFPMTKLVYDLGQVGYQVPLRKTRLAYGPFCVDTGNQSIYFEKELLQLSKKQFLLLSYLLRNTGRPVSRLQIWEAVWGLDSYPLTNSVDALIARLRRRLPARAANCIRRNFGIGYQLVLPVEVGSGELALSGNSPDSD